MASTVNQPEYNRDFHGALFIPTMLAMVFVSGIVPDNTIIYLVLSAVAVMAFFGSLVVVDLMACPPCYVTRYLKRTAFYTVIFLNSFLYLWYQMTAT